MDPSQGGHFVLRGWGGCSFHFTAVIEKKAPISIGNGVLGKFNKVYVIQLSRWRGGRFQHSLGVGVGVSLFTCLYKFML